MDLKDKAVLLTGGSAGIGRELAHLLKEKGARVTLTGRNKDRLAEMQDEGFEVIEADLSNAKGVDALIADIGEREFDVLINNAGQLVDHDFRKELPDPNAADDCIYANLSAPIRLTTALVPMLGRQPEASIVNVTSGLAIAPAARQPVYCATKSGLRAYSLTLREQLKDTNIHVIEALPPVVDTQMNADNPMSKMPAAECAAQILDAIETNRAEANIGMTKLLKLAESISPALARSITLRF
ncbi:SDR family NAD(P)-dependent oxidoreductase [Altererythrobacter sp.]|uniref:SDR family oxidoreductase n=1 Tax=Altererythrobacter sp. TaxID=1872480 RepID=UPI001B034402|nr:SDR family NAD(P)-dependent oxidoreductase [Altererythrobacter sp.]MBO6609647.1 SDR family NAD(P)-dependent oxidoreductase [Altererythrobacter sp.]MBO6641203.1 SDR family NAD(P)-dependent oxidoreductase [Altererythrobacter sp.]MBO6708099.1 SDR family NAD(P)-dependent oxidoreductase [Altererythrobacter sp.]MBO6945767.1 SDR family NAD(P)-dependent oxidoreductase [Altererythrobacter sp.]